MIFFGFLRDGSTEIQTESTQNKPKEEKKNTRRNQIDDGMVGQFSKERRWKGSTACTILWNSLNHSSDSTVFQHQYILYI